MPRSCRASKEGLKKAEKAFQLKGWTQDYLAGAAQCTRQTVIKFFARRPVAKHLFQAMCNELDLEWGEIAELEPEEEQYSRNLCMDTEQGKTSEVVKEERSATQVLTSPVSLVQKHNANCKEQLVITFTGDIETLQKNPNYQAGVLAFMQAVSKDASLTIEKIEKGSIKITFSGSPEGLKRLKEQIKPGESVLGMPVENVQLLLSSTTGEEQEKIRLVQEIIAQGAKGRDLSDADLSNADLSNADLSRADLSRADLSRADLSRADLSRADLSCANLTSTDLSRADLRGTDLNCADLRGTDLSDADLRLAYLHDTVIDEATRISNKWRLVWKIVNQASEGRDLSGTDLRGANLRGANLRGADLRGANLRGADLNDTDLSLAYLHDAVIDEATRISNKWHLVWKIVNQASEGQDLSSADLSLANLSGADLRGANLSGANLSRTFLSGADLRGANLSGANLSLAYLHDAVIDEATRISNKWRLVWEIVNQTSKGRNLSGAELSLANLSGADLRGANLSGADLRGANLNRADLNFAYLHDAVIDEATRISNKWRLVWEIVNQATEGRDLSGTDLSSADLSGANLRNANLRNTDLRNADLRNTDLRNAIVENAQFGRNLGLTEDMKRDLKRRGAIFEDSPGDRSGVLTFR